MSLAGLFDLLLPYADLISAGFGLAGALVLGVPAWAGARAKHQWEVLTDLEATHDEDAVSAGALKRIRQQVEADQLGDSRSARRVNRWGFGLLVISFALLGVASLHRAHERAEAQSARLHTGLR